MERALEHQGNSEPRKTLILQDQNVEKKRHNVRAPRIHQSASRVGGQNRFVRNRAKVEIGDSYSYHSSEQRSITIDFCDITSPWPVCHFLEFTAKVMGELRLILGQQASFTLMEQLDRKRWNKRTVILETVSFRHHSLFCSTLILLTQFHLTYRFRPIA
jgi:hypothetical protein